MKALALLLLLSTTLHASIDTLTYEILPGKWHKGGTLEAMVVKTDTEKKVMDVLIIPLMI